MFRKAKLNNFIRDSSLGKEPQRHLEFLNVPIIVAHGSLETPDFQRQGRDFAKAVKDMGKAVDYKVGQNYNTFEIPETIANPHGILGKLVLTQMKLI